MRLQIDASPHDWLGGRGPTLTLVGAIDDATNYRWARFVEAETTWAYLDLMEQIFTDKGIPLSLYSDRHSIFISPREPTIVEQLKEIDPETQFGRAMRELGVRIIPAYSPQAKGRVERMWGILQDRPSRSKTSSSKSHRQDPSPRSQAVASTSSNSTTEASKSSSGHSSWLTSVPPLSLDCFELGLS